MVWCALRLLTHAPLFAYTQVVQQYRWSEEFGQFEMQPVHTRDPSVESAASGAPPGGGAIPGSNIPGGGIGGIGGGGAGKPVSPLATPSNRSLTDAQMQQQPTRSARGAPRRMETRVLKTTTRTSQPPRRRRSR